MEKPDTDKPVFKVFKEEQEAAKNSLCPFCKKPIKGEDFRDELSRKEYKISGLCQECQDKMFG